MTTFVASNVLTAAQLNGIQPLAVIKASTETVTNSATLQNDDELFVDFSTTGQSWLIHARLICTGTAAKDIQIAWARTGTLNHVGTRSCVGPSVSTTDVSGTATAATTVGVVRRSGGHGLTTAITYGVDGTATNGAIEESFILNVGAAGRLTLQWAQNSAGSGTSVSVTSGSYLYCVPLLS